jgi:hypothetical protein
VDAVELGAVVNAWLRRPAATLGRIQYRIAHRFLSTGALYSDSFAVGFIEFGDAKVTEARRSSVNVVQQDPPKSGGNPRRKGE